jgi:copper chaperone NosL
MKNVFHITVSALLIAILTACSEPNGAKVVAHNAAKIDAADECHLCGMLIVGFNGPKGELYKKGLSADASNKVNKFCSTRDMFSFYLEPENTRNVTTMLVHDMSKMLWENLDDDFFIDARSAWYVAGSSKTGAMGKTLASFSQKQQAEAFADEFGGKVLNFAQIDLSVLM